MLADKRPSEPAIAALDFTSALSKAANGVSIVTASHEGISAGLTVSSMCSVCAEPAMMLACVNAENEFCTLAEASGYFAINLLKHDQQSLSNRFAGLLDPAPEDRFGKGDWDLLNHQAPVLNDALVSLVCSVDSSVLHGTHRVFFGRVLAANTSDGEALVYSDRAYARVLGDSQQASSNAD